MDAAAAAAPPSDVDMAPDEMLSHPAPLASDLPMDDDPAALATADGGLSEEQMAGSDDDEAGEPAELVMEDLETAPPAPDVMHLEPADDAAVVHDVSFEVEVADATPEVEILSETSPAGATIPYLPPPSTKPETAEPVAEVVVAAPHSPDAESSKGVEVALATVTSPPVTESFVLVEVPSDAEENGLVGGAVKDGAFFAQGSCSDRQNADQVFLH
jgi:hypothetical protein